MLPSFSAFPTKKLAVVIWPTDCSHLLSSTEESILSRSLFLNIVLFFNLDNISPKKYLWKCHKLSTGILNLSVLPTLWRNVSSHKLLASWILPHKRYRRAMVSPVSWALSLGFFTGLHLSGQTAATRPCLPSPRDSSVLGEVARHCVQPELESAGMKPVWGCVCDENLRFVNSLYPQVKPLLPWNAWMFKYTHKLIDSLCSRKKKKKRIFDFWQL